MEHGEDQREDTGSAFTDWMKSATEFWLSAAKSWGLSETGDSPGPQSSSRGFADRLEQGWQSLFKTWQTSFSALSSPHTLEALLKGVNAGPEAAMRIARTTWEGYFQLHQMWLKHAGRLGEATKAYSFEGVETDFFREWTAFYEKEIQPALKMPQVGLTRFYQERLNDALDKMAGFQTAVGEFIHLMSLPVEKSLRVLQEKIETQAREGNLSANFKDYYNLWVKVLEGHYMTLFKSPEYIQSLSYTLRASQERRAALDETLMDLLQFLPIPTNRDMDELYRDLHQLKKTVREMARKLSALESAT